MVLLDLGFRFGTVRGEVWTPGSHGDSLSLHFAAEALRAENGKPLPKQRKRAEIHCLKRRFASSNCLSLFSSAGFENYIFAKMSGMLDLSSDEKAKHFFPRWLCNVANVIVLPVPMLPIAILAPNLFLRRCHARRKNSRQFFGLCY